MTVKTGVCLLVATWCLAASSHAKPIMVAFGTSQGPIVPPPPTTAASATPNVAQSRSLVVRSPAPVREEREDVPNPNQYRAPVPHQYRSNLYQVRPPPNLILGTPLDIKYTPSIEKYELHRKQYARTLGKDYTGPHVFEKQDYEIARETKTVLRPSTRYRKPHYQEINRRNEDNKVVPQIGVVYSSGVRYYVPQVTFYEQNVKNSAGEEENSVYDKKDEKYYHYGGQQ